MPTIDQLSAQLDRLATWDPGPFPVVSLYLNLQPGDRGRDEVATFVRKELEDRINSYPAEGPERASLQKDLEKIREYADGVDPAANGLALFSCSGADLFEPVQLSAPVNEHQLSISDHPHLYPLARLVDEYPRYAVLLADTKSARIFVFAVNALEREAHVEGVKTKHHKKGGWSQARYQRHTENYHVQHAKEIIDALARIVRAEAIQSVIVAGDEVIVPLIREQLPKELADRVVDIVKLDIRTPERTVLDRTLEVMREQDAKSDRERVEEVVGAYRANALGAVGVDLLRRALELGQVDELLITATAAGEQAETADELIRKARQTSASVRFIEDPSLLAPFGGAAASLRFKL